MLGIASALGFGGGAIGSAIGCLLTTKAGVATISEDTTQTRNTIILAALPITQTMYGAIFGIYLSTTVMPKAAVLSSAAAGGIVGLGIAVFLAESLSAWAQGVTCATAISMLSKTKGQITPNSLVLAAYTEFVGILGMVFGIAISSLMTM